MKKYVETTKILASKKGGNLSQNAKRLAGKKNEMGSTNIMTYNCVIFDSRKSGDLKENRYQLGGY
jgi:hypothetical protein